MYVSSVYGVFILSLRMYIIPSSVPYLLTTFLSLSPPAERQPHPEQLLHEDVILFLPEVGRRLSRNRSISDPQSSNCPTDCTWAGQAGFHTWLYSEDSRALQTKAQHRPHHWPGEPLSTRPIWIPTSKKRTPLKRHQRALNTRERETHDDSAWM